MTGINPSTIFEIFDAARMEAGEISLLLQRADTPQLADYLCPEASKELEIALLPFECFLNGRGIPHQTSDKLMAAAEGFLTQWNELIKSTGQFLRATDRQVLAAALKKAADATFAALENKKADAAANQRIYLNLTDCLRRASTAAADGISEGNPVLRKLDNMERNEKNRHEETLSAMDEITKTLANNALSFDWKKCKLHSPRLLCDKEFENIKDEKHTGHPDYPAIKPYLNLPGKASIAIKELLDASKAKSPDKWWTSSVFKDKEFKGQSYSEAFGPKLEAAHRFKRDQIEVGTNNYHKGKWRILPDQDFLERYRKNHPPKDALSGS